MRIMDLQIIFLIILTVLFQDIINTNYGKKILNYSACVLIAFFFFGCNKDGENMNELSSFDISPNGDFIVYSRIKNHKSSLYKAKIDGSDIKLLASEEKYSFFNPKITLDGQYVFYIGSNEENMRSSIWKFNFDTGSRKIFEDVGYISEIIFSRYNNNIFYIKAKEYDSYSPIVSRSFHNFDIYSLSDDTEKTKKISSLNAYGISDLQEFDENKFILSQRGVGSENGIFYYSDNFKTELKKITTTNDTLRNSTGYSNPVVLDNYSLICASYYQLVKIDLNTRLEKTILPSNGYHFKQINYNKKLKKIFFTKRDNTDNLYSIDINGGNFEAIKLGNIEDL